MRKQIAIRIEDATYSRLQALAAHTGRTATYYIREAIETHLEDLEDIYLAEQTLNKLRRGKERTYTLDEVEKLNDKS